MILRSYFLIILSSVSIVLQKTSGSNIPGIPGVDYPNFNEIPPTTFRCPASKLSGFFPDFETRCQVFHYCEDGNRETFICPIGFIFNPLIKSCDRWFNYECNAPQPYDEERSHDRQTDYEVASDGDVASLFQSSSSLFDKMASLFENKPSEGYGQYEIENGPRVNPNVDQFSEYGSSDGSSEHRVETMGENEESRREASEISSGDFHSDLKQSEGFGNEGPFPYEPNDRNAEGWDSEDSVSLKSSFQDDDNLKNRGHVHSERETNIEKNNEGIVREHISGPVHGGEYKGVGSYSGHSGQSKGPGVLYYRNPTFYNYHTRSNEHNENHEGDSIFYAGEVNDPQGHSHSSLYERDVDFDDFDESDVDSDQSMDLQKRISEYRRRPRPKPVVSLIESDLEIVTLPPLRQKRPRISLVQKNAEPAVTEPMMTTTELSTDAQHKSETTESSSPSDATKSISEDVTGDDESRMSSDFQQERRGNERGFEDWSTEESSGDAEDFLESEDLDTSLDHNQNDEESEETDTDIEQLHSMMRPNLFYVDSNSDHSVEGDESMDHGVQTEEYNQDDNFNGEIEDSSEVLQSDQYADSFDTEKNQYENKNEGTEDFGEMFQTVIDGETKSFIRLGEEIIDATEYYPDWKETSSAEREGESFYDAVDKASEKYAAESSKGTSYQSDESQDLNSFTLDQIKRTSTEATDAYITDREYSYQDGNSSPDFATDLDGTVSEEVTFIPSIEYEFPTTEAYDMINADGVYMYGGSRDSDTMESFYRDDQSYIAPSYTDEHANFEEQRATNEDTVMSSADDETSSSDVIYYYPADMGSQFVTDQPDMDIATTAMTDDEEYAASTDIQGDSEYDYEFSQSDDSDTDEEFKEKYLTTHSAISDDDVQFVTDQTDYRISPTVMPGDGYSRDESIQGESDMEFKEHHFQTDSYDSDLGTRFVTDQPDVEMSTIAMLDDEEYSTDTDIGEELKITLDTSHSEGSDSDEEFQEYLQAHSDFSELKADFENEKESNTDVDNVEQASELSNHDKAKREFDVSSDTLPSIFDITRTSDISKKLDSNFDKSIISNKHHKISEAAEEFHSKETSIDSSNFDFDSVEDTGLEMENESSKEDSQASTSGNPKLKSQSACPNCPLSVNRFERIERSSHPGRTGKLLEGSKLAKLASFVKKMVAAKKKAKLNLVKKILPSSEWNTEA